MHNVIVLIDTSNNAWYSQVHWLIVTPYLSTIASNVVQATSLGIGESKLWFALIFLWKKPFLLFFLFSLLTQFRLSKKEAAEKILQLHVARRQQEEEKR